MAKKRQAPGTNEHEIRDTIQLLVANNYPGCSAEFIWYSGRESATTELWIPHHGRKGEVPNRDYLGWAIILLPPEQNMVVARSGASKWNARRRLIASG